MTVPSLTVPAPALPVSRLSAVRRFWSDEEGATLVEYVLLVALIAAVCVGTITLLGTSANTKLTTASDALK